MHTNTEQCTCYDRIWASFIFFTRLPLWRLHEPPKESYKTVVEHWPLTGWLTGGLMAATLYVGSLFLPYMVAVLLAIAVRMFLTGALHEDGLADFFDGFGGGGSDRGRILTIMKDSHIGTFGVLGLVLYILLLASALFSMPAETAALTILAADPFDKMLTAGLITLPYARKEEEAKAKVVYRRISLRSAVSLALQGLLPMIILGFSPNLPLVGRGAITDCIVEGGKYVFLPLKGELEWGFPFFVSIVVYTLLYMFIRRRLQGYTGDCCGAVCLLVELSVFLAMSAL